MPRLNDKQIKDGENPEVPVQEKEVVILTENELINLKLDKILELLGK